MSYLEEIAREIGAELGETDPVNDRDRLFLLYALLVLVKGSQATRRDVHDAWTTWQVMRGQAHEALVPFDALDAATQAEDEPYRQAIHRVAAKRERGRGG